MKKIVSLLLLSGLILAGCDADARRERAIGKAVEKFVEEAQTEKQAAPELPALPSANTYFMDFYGYSFDVPDGYGLTEFYEEDNTLVPDIVYISKEPIPLDADMDGYTSLAVWPDTTADDYLGLVGDEVDYKNLGTETINGYVYTKISISMGDMGLNVPYTRISYVYDVSKDYTVAVFSYDEKNETEAKPLLETLSFL
ncbi:MAG: hypothetical protein AAB802_00710 [Patescibacteria group bacterium]